MNDRLAEFLRAAGRHEDIEKARTAIVRRLGGPWEKGKLPRMGSIDCPICGLADGLYFSRSGYSGKITASCETEGCVSWAE